MKNIHFRVKRMALAAEARIIKAEEAKALRIARALKRSNKGADKTDRAYATLASLHHHRTQVVRPAARALHLAQAYLKGMPYKQVEAKTHGGISLPVVGVVAENVRKFGPVSCIEVKGKHILDWIDAGPTLIQLAAAAAEAQATLQSAIKAG